MIIIFCAPQHITSDPPPSPYVDMSAEPILRRVLAKEILREAFQDIDVVDFSSADNVHGEFCQADEWNSPPHGSPDNTATGESVRELVKNWISSNSTRISNMCDVLLHATNSQLYKNRKEILNFMQNSLIIEIDKVVSSSDFTQNSLSERLANAGLLPMFGFPTRVRHLFHKWPQARGKWLSEDVVDRPMDIAISQFAPGSETIKEGLVHTAVGVVKYQKQGQRIVEVQNPLGSPMLVGFCKCCQTIDSSNSPSQVCCVCGAKPDDYRIINLSQPADFRTMFGAECDYDGAFEWTPYATRPKLGTASVKTSVHSSANFESWHGPRTVYVINDNNGYLFDFEKLAVGETWATRSAVEKASSKAFQKVPSKKEFSRPKFVTSGVSDKRALAFVSRTDVLITGIHAWPEGIFADPLRIEGRAALYSLGFMLRRAAAVQLDIDSSELKVGLHTTAGNDNKIVGQIFLSDTLENGAGYSTYLGQHLQLEALFQALVEQKLLPNHDAECKTSCYDCMRDYSNLAYHSLLDWRLALDLARLAIDAKEPIDFTPQHWSGITEFATRCILQALPGSRRATYGTLPSVTHGKRAIIISHPLWDVRSTSLHPLLFEAKTDAEHAGQEPCCKSTFMLIRQPFDIYRG